MFERLPEELLREVAKGLNIQDVKTLSLVSKTFHAIWAPRFWSTLCVNTAGPGDRPSSVSIKRIEQCAHALQNATSSIQHVADMVFRRDTRWKLWDYEKEEDWPNVACLHRQPPPEDLGVWRALLLAAPVAGWLKDEWPLRNQRCVEASIERMGKQLGPDNMDDVALAVQSVLERIPAGQLQSFTWDLATCIPQPILDSLFQTQPQLQSISLTADTRCKAMTKNIHLPFCQLKRIICNTIPRSHVLPVRIMLENNRGHLHDLQIEELPYGGLFEELLFSPKECEDSADRCHSMLGANLDVLFPSLATLSLRSVYLTKRMDRAFNISGLDALTLRQCSRSSEFLERIMAANRPLQLKTFEFMSGHGHDNNDYDAETNTVNTFLLSFNGLENLYIGFARDFDEDSAGLHPLWSTVGHHGSTLKRLVVHQRGVWTGPMCTMGVIEKNIDLVSDVDGTLDISETNISKWALDPAENPLSALPKLECLGLPFAVSDWSESDTWASHSIEPDAQSESFIITLLKPFTGGSRRLRLLHLRKTGSDYAWAFKATSLPPCSRRRRALSTRAHGEEDVFLLPIPPSDMLSSLRPPFSYFLNWAFGPKGIRSLQAVAFGDFANGHMGGKFLHNIFAIRNKDELQGYQVFDCRDKAHEHKWRAMADRYADFLESCPVGPRVERWEDRSRYYF
ncbi:uncharacterized protein QC761_0024260 [Podospora bellae-mahoneyi]|uniref:F-box domain-containing protein n=1 Tax=Podospora bellae-mahoneyi TaxID=2093777 RepID=A0ABR0G1V3_9PEZI|nr:hypothetical protein QC761_0024260 [Podospora bellae-mahoneyi]